MRSARTGKVLLAFVLLVVWGGAVGCKDHSTCDDIAVGTSLASLPKVFGREQYLGYCYSISPHTEELALLECCSRAPQGSPPVRHCGSSGQFDCGTLPPFELWRVGLPYGDWSCEPQPDFPSYAPPYNCLVWVRDGGVIGTCGGCSPD